MQENMSRGGVDADKSRRLGHSIVIPLAIYRSAEEPQVQMYKRVRLGNGILKNSVRNRVRIDDVGSILNFRMGFSFGEDSAGFCMSV